MSLVLPANPSCGLTHQPCVSLRSADIRKWLKEDEAWKKYRNVKMEWITHHNPDLVILDHAGNEKERIDLEGMSYKAMDKLMKEKGFKKLGMN